MMKTLVRISLLCALGGCVVDNRTAPEAEGSESTMDVSQSGMDQMLAPEIDAGSPVLMPVTCTSEDDLYSVDPVDIEIGFSREDLYLCAGTTDRFRLRGEPGQEVYLKLVADPIDADLDLTLLNEEGQVISSSAEETGNESIVFQFGPELDTVIIEVDGYRETSAAYYFGALARCTSDRECPDGNICDRESGICVVETDPECGIDEFEPNNREDTPTEIEMLPATIEANLCAPDIDWYAFDVARGDIINILATFPEGVDLDMQVNRASDGQKVTEAISDSRTNPERIVLAHVPEGRYILGVTKFVPEGERDRDTAYQLELVGRSGECMTDRDCVTTEQPVCDAGVCIAAQSNAALGDTCGVDGDCSDEADLCYTGGTGGQDNICTLRCQADEQCNALGDGAYCQPISWREAVCIPPCASNDDCGDFYVCSEQRCVVDSACRTDDDCEMDRICRTARTGDRYCATPGAEATCGTDLDLEPNGRFAQAFELPVNQRIQDLRICNEDDDYFVFRLPEADAPWRLDIEVSFRRGTDIDLYVFDALGNELGESISPDQTEETVNLDLLASGDIYVRIDQFDSNRLDDTVYTLLATLEPTESRCTVMNGLCDETQPLRSICDEMSGACLSFEGNGMVGLGDACDSNDDCVADAELCWTYGMGSPPICTRTCQNDQDCEDVSDTECVRIRRGLGMCL